MKRKLTLAVLIPLAAFFVFAASAAAGQKTLAGEMIRLRVIAASDREEDQRVKLLVRDLLLEEIALERPSDRDGALLLLREKRDELEEKVSSLLRREGAEYTSSIGIGTVSYPQTDYEGYSLPAGEYTALTVTLGDGKGKNWWCVLFPPLCYGMEPDGELIETGVFLTEETDDLSIRFKFRVLDWIGAVKERIRDRKGGE